MATTKFFKRSIIVMPSTEIKWYHMKCSINIIEDRIRGEKQRGNHIIENSYKQGRY